MIPVPVAAEKNSRIAVLENQYSGHRGVKAQWCKGYSLTELFME